MNKIIFICLWKTSRLLRSFARKLELYAAKRFDKHIIVCDPHTAIWTSSNGTLPTVKELEELGL